MPCYEKTFANYIQNLNVGSVRYFSRTDFTSESLNRNKNVHVKFEDFIEIYNGNVNCNWPTRSTKDLLVKSENFLVRT